MRISIVFVFTVVLGSVVQPIFQSDLRYTRGLRGELAPCIAGTILIRAYISPFLLRPSGWVPLQARNILDRYPGHVRGTL